MVNSVTKINLISSLGTDEFCEMHTKSDNIEIMNGTETSDAINELFKSFITRYQEGLETKMKGSSFIFERVDLLYYDLHKISLDRAGSYIDSPEWLNAKIATINPKNENNGCFKHAITVALNHQKIGKNPQRISKIKPFLNTYNWKDIKFPSYSNDSKKFEQNNGTIALNILYVPYSTKQIRPAYISKYNYKRDNQVVLLMITDNEKWHYRAVKSVPGLLTGITSNRDADFYCLIHTQQRKNLKSIKEYAEIMIFVI